MPVTKKNLKATKKFEKKHLKSILDKRKDQAKIKQRNQLRDKRKTTKTKDAEFFKGGDKAGAAADKAAISGVKKNAKVNEMSVDDFFQGGFEFIDQGPDGKKKDTKLGKRKRVAAPAEGEEAQEEEESGAEDDGSEDDAFSDISVGDPVVSDSDEEGEDEDEDENRGMSQKAMDDLATKDPEFYKFLKETDPEALDFDQDADLAEVDSLSGGEDDDDEEEEEQPKKKRKQSKKKAKEEDEEADGSELTKEMVAKWKKSMVEDKSLRAARRVVLAFRSAAHLNEGDEEDQKREKYIITSPQVFNDVLIAAMKHVPEVMNHHLPVKESSSGKLYVQTESKKFKTLSLLLKTYTASAIHLLGTLSDERTLKLTISSLEPVLPYLLTFRKLLKALIKTIVNFWSQQASTESTKVTAFLILRRIMVIGDKGIRETVLKLTYQGLIQGCRVTNHNTIRGIHLLKNSAAELWGIDPGVGYTTAFGFIRQLALHLRNSIVHNKKDAHRAIYNWQYTHSLDFWSVVLAEHCSPLKEAEAGHESQLKLLIYPLVQVTLGAMRLIPSSTYFPLRFHLVRAILRLSRSTGTYVPLASPLLEVLSSVEMKKAPKSSTLKPLDFAVNYKASKAYLRTRTYQDGVGEQVIELLSEFLLLWATNIAFPEFSLPVVIQLKRYLKQARQKSTGNKNMKLSAALVTLVQKIEANGKFIEGKRSGVDFAPRDRSQVDNFLKGFELQKTPLGAYVFAQRKGREEKEKMLEEAREEERRKKDEEKGGAAGSGASDSEGEEEEEEDVDMIGEDDEEEEDDEEMDGFGDEDEDDE
ncbi:related to excision repair protein RAD4 [Cephalotrichum gorgonifer]|uniref:Related to excision repair protein RAD4 n=1 Tax=Cephalotrichum gorgonifer TaxID=2041049 RepID=A0AAE8N013_9PEZI|nr:related to excision repair protein RAD4 [Cephalotrichum gorgonifer]